MTNITIIDGKFKSDSASWSEFIDLEEVIPLRSNLYS